MNMSTARSARAPLNHESRAVIVSACEAVMEGGADPQLVAAYLSVIAEFLRIGLRLEDIEALLGTPPTRNKPLEAP